MKRMMIAATAIFLMTFATMAMASDSATVDVTANVVGTCQFTTAGTTIPLGNLPFDAAGNPMGATAGSTINFWCTNGATYAITDDLGSNETGAQMRLASTTLATPEYIDYGLSYNPASGTGSGPGTPIVLNLTATVGATYGGNTADAYADTVTLTVTP